MAQFALSDIANDKPLLIVAAAIEHLAIAKGFGRKNGYTIDQSQELVYLGTTNFCTYSHGITLIW
jgi:sodium-independent sulfate anion transporter 11